LVYPASLLEQKYLKRGSPTKLADMRQGELSPIG
jgi:hypothetical protein